MNDTVTILGRVGGDPNRSVTSSGIPVVNFRVASPQRRYDSKTQTWVETGTNWYNVSAFRQLAEHAKASLHSGDGVIVTGRLKLREWESGGRKGLSADIDADAIGHDLRWGASAYVKARSAAPTYSSQADAEAAPSDSERISGLIDADGGERRDEGDLPVGDDDQASELAFAGNAWATND